MKGTKPANRSVRSARSSVQPAPAERPARLQLRIAAGLLVLAALVWGVVLVWQGRAAPARPHIEAGIAYDQQGQEEKALAEWKTAVRLDPNSANAWMLLSDAYVSLNRWPEAAEAYRNLLRVKPDQPDIYTSLATCTLRAGDQSAALRYAELALKRNPNDVGALAIAAYLSPALGDQKERLDYLRRLVKLLPDDIEFRLMLAQPLTQKLLLAEARHHVDQVLRLDPDNAPALALRGYIRFTENPSPQSLAESEADLRRSLEIDPLNAFALFHLGRVYKQMGRPARAVPLLEQAVRLMPSRHQYHYELAEAYQQNGNTVAAAQERARFEKLRHEMDRTSLLEKRVVSFPDDFDSNLEYGLLLLDKGDLQKARVCLERAQTLRPEDVRAKVGLQQLAVLTGGPDHATPALPKELRR